MERRIEPKCIALVLTVFAANLLLTGLIFGWAPLLLMLQDEEQYAELCAQDGSLVSNRDDSSDSGFLCARQENKLNLMFAIASVAMNVAALPVGMFVDYAGPTKAVVVAAIVELSGLLLMAFADSQTFDVFLPAYSMLALGGSITMMTSFPASFVIVQYQTAILAGINCLFDGSSVVFLVLYSLHSTFATTRQQLFIGLTVIAGVIYLLLIVFWYVNESSLSSASQSSPSDIIKSQVNDAEAPQPPTPSASYSAVVDVPIMVDTSEQQELQLVDVAIRKQLVSTEFVFILVFATIQMLCCTIYIGTTNKLLENYGDGDHDFLYTKIFSGILPLGFLFVPVINFIVEKKGLVLSLLVTNGLGLAYNVLALIPNLPIQCLTFILFTGFRSFLYAVLSVFVAKIFGLQNLGTLMGINFSVGAIVNLLEYPAVFISNEYFDGSLTTIYAFTLVLCAALIPLTLYFRNHERAKEEQRRKFELQRASGPRLVN